MAKKQDRPVTAKGITKQPGYVAHGSEQHAQMLGLRRATADDKLVKDSWTLIDPTAFGPTARIDFLEEVLAQRVRELNTAPVAPQSKDPRKPNYAPPLPPESRQVLPVGE